MASQAASQVATQAAAQQTYDVVIVGSGHAGAFMAYELGMQKKRVLVIEAGSTTHRNREDYMENFYLSTFKSPESPYPPTRRYQKQYACLNYVMEDHEPESRS